MCGQQLSLDDRFALHELYSEYAVRYDGSDPEGWVELFTPDGRFSTVGRTDFRGRDQLLAFARHRMAEKPGVTHHTSTISLRATADGVRGRAYAIVLRVVAGEPLRLLNVGEYRDLLVRVDGAWRFAERQFHSSLPDEALDAEIKLVPSGDAA